MSVQLNIEVLRDSLNKLANSREKSLALTKLEECEMWISKVLPAPEAPAARAMTYESASGTKTIVLDEGGKVIGRQG